ncbi:hypothetical protein D3C71_1889390 [compost metagenome]
MAVSARRRTIMVGCDRTQCHFMPWLISSCVSGLRFTQVMAPGSCSNSACQEKDASSPPCSAKARACVSKRWGRQMSSLSMRATR